MADGAGDLRSRRGELDGVAQQVDVDLLDPQPVHHRVGDHGPAGVHAEADALFPHTRLHHVIDRRVQLPQVRVLQMQLHPARLDPAHVQNVVDKAQQILAGGQQLAQQLLRLRPPRVLPDELGQAENGVHGRADLVAHAGEELALGLRRAAGLLQRAAQRLAAAALPVGGVRDVRHGAADHPAGPVQPHERVAQPPHPAAGSAEIRVGHILVLVLQPVPDAVKAQAVQRLVQLVSGAAIPHAVQQELLRPRDLPGRLLPVPGGKDPGRVRRQIDAQEHPVLPVDQRVHDLLPRLAVVDVKGIDAGLQIARGRVAGHLDPQRQPALGTVDPAAAVQRHLGNAPFIRRRQRRPVHLLAEPLRLLRRDGAVLHPLEQRVRGAVQIRQQPGIQRRAGDTGISGEIQIRRRHRVPCKFPDLLVLAGVPLHILTALGAVHPGAQNAGPPPVRVVKRAHADLQPLDRPVRMALPHLAGGLVRARVDPIIRPEQLRHILLQRDAAGQPRRGIILHQLRYAEQLLRVPPLTDRMAHGVVQPVVHVRMAHSRLKRALVGLHILLKPLERVHVAEHGVVKRPAVRRLPADGLKRHPAVSTVLPQRAEGQPDLSAALTAPVHLPLKNLPVLRVDALIHLDLLRHHGRRGVAQQVVKPAVGVPQARGAVQLHAECADATRRQIHDGLELILPLAERGLQRPALPPVPHQRRRQRREHRQRRRSRADKKRLLRAGCEGGRRLCLRGRSRLRPSQKQRGAQRRLRRCAPYCAVRSFPVLHFLTSSRAVRACFSLENSIARPQSFGKVRQSTSEHIEIDRRVMEQGPS